MPYLRCPNCGLLAHVIAAADAVVIHCPRCRGDQRQFGLSPVEESLRHLSPAPEDPDSPTRGT